MNSRVLEQYENILFTDEQLPLFNKILSIQRETKDTAIKEIKHIKVADVFILIGKRSNNRGITKKEIQDELGISRHICDDIISLLQGATLIQYDDVARGMLWKVTKRGYQLAKYYNQNK